MDKLKVYHFNVAVFTVYSYIHHHTYFLDNNM